MSFLSPCFKSTPTMHSLDNRFFKKENLKDLVILRKQAICLPELEMKLVNKAGVIGLKLKVFPALSLKVETSRSYFCGVMDSGMVLTK